MMNNDIEKRVLALKYRPRRFEDLVGQSTISQTLSLALDSSRLSHAYLFSGLRGSGKTSTARIMAKALLCSNGPTSKPCEVCDNCLSANSNRHLDIIEMDAASNRGIDDIKDLIEHTKYKPSSARFKVFIIDEVHMLTTQAFNALLKTLEEPPGFVKFILATTDPLKVPATILSRTQHFRFNKIAPNDVLHHLSHILNEENIDFETNALEIITRSGHGSLRDTLTLLDQAIIFSKGKITTNAVVDMLGLIEPELMDKVFDVILKNQDFRTLVKELENFEISQVCDEMTIYLKEKMLDKDARFDLLLFDRFFRILSDAKHLLALNSDGGFVLILTLMKMSEATKLRTIDDIINQVEQIEPKEENRAFQNTNVASASISHEIKTNNNINESISLETNNNSTLNSEKELEKTQEIKSSQSIEKEVQSPVNQEFIEENPTQDISLSTPFDNTSVSLDIVDSIPTVNSVNNDTLDVNSTVNNFSTPFDEDFVSPSENTQNIAQEQEKKEEVHEVQEVPEYQNQAMHNPFEEVTEEYVEDYEDEEEDDPSSIAYEDVIQKVYDRDYDLGVAFEKNFIYRSFENNTLKISSFAQDEERKFLFKHFGVLKMFIYEVFGEDIELDFIKEEASKEIEKEEANLKQVSQENKPEEKQKDNSNETGSMIEDIEMGSGCVADMQKTANPEPSQKELQMNDILNSAMINSAKELLDIKRITVKTKT